MKIVDIEVSNKLIIKFIYKDKPYSMVVDLIAKSSQYIVIPAILQYNEVVDPSLLANVEIIYTVKDGIFRYEYPKIETSVLQGIRVYLVSAEDDVARLNRRNAYRVFIGEVVKLYVTSQNGSKKDYEGILKDVSISGMGVVLKNELEIGSTISIIYNYEGLNIHLSGQVIRKKKINRYRAFVHGCRFDTPNNGISRVLTLMQIRNKNDNTDETIHK